MDTRTLTTSSVTIEDLQGVVKEIRKIEETPVIIDSDYIGNINCSGELMIASNINKEQFDKLFKEIPKSNEIYVGIDYGKGIDESMIMQCTLNRQITNIHRIRKGKRYIIKFDYTGVLNLIGEVNR